MKETKVFDEETIEDMSVFARRMRGEIYQFVTSNITKAQDKQKKDFDRSYLSNNKIKVGDLILLRNNKKNDRKVGKFSFTWLCPYIVSDITIFHN